MFISKAGKSVLRRVGVALIITLQLWSTCSDAFFNGEALPKIRKRCYGVDGRYSQNYLPEEQSCCEGNVFPIPETTHAQCCGGRAYWRNESKPENCTVPGCGTGRRHQATEICCNRKAVFVGTDQNKLCCGTTVVDTWLYSCCGQTPIRLNSHYECCGYEDIRTSYPIHKLSMSCSTTSNTKSVTLNRRQYFTGSDVCQGTLPEWDVIRPLPMITNGSHQHMRGWPEKCSIKAYRSGTKILIPINPFFTGTELDSECADSQTLHVIITLSKNQKCPNSTEMLQQYLHGVTLDIYFRNKIKCRKDGTPYLRIKNNYNAVMYLSRHSNAILAQSVRFA